jgi:hypothetical protein
MTLEQLVNERNTIYASMHEAAENPNNSYTARKNLGAILNHDYPTDVPNPNEYINKESVLNEYLRLSVKKREDEIKATVGADIQKYIAEIEDESLAELALTLDPQYIELVRVDSTEKMQKLVMKYASNPGLCMDLISTAYHPEDALKRVYMAVVDVKRMEIENRNKLYSIVDRNKVPNRTNIENYFMKNLNASDERLKGAAYLKIADEYCK